ncbi:hypothetical protein Syun_016899 [Stephania yunnanensis]|uniref:Uncharacterized protein n=1 Tax=Stephania yunnanensis TaxID=152371 RepID=A0AAP0J896_9MAGN
MESPQIIQYGKRDNSIAELMQTSHSTISLVSASQVISTGLAPTECLSCHYIAFLVLKISKKHLFTYLSSRKSERGLGCVKPLRMLHRIQFIFLMRVMVAKLFSFIGLSNRLINLSGFLHWDVWTDLGTLYHNTCDYTLDELRPELHQCTCVGVSTDLASVATTKDGTLEVVGEAPGKILTSKIRTRHPTMVS